MGRNSTKPGLVLRSCDVVFTAAVLLTTLMASLMVTFMVTKEAAANELKVPFVHARGGKLYNDKCAMCHGETLTGTKQGPPLLHPFYKPSHHADAAFYRAALKGVQAHHWEFGDMPPIQGVTKEDMDAIVPFIRWYQKEKGLIK